jgi:hypothetical protein
MRPFATASARRRPGIDVLDSDGRNRQRPTPTMRRRGRLLLLAALLAASPAQAAPGLTRTTLARLPDTYVPDTLAFSAALDRVAYAARDGDGECVMHGDQPGPRFRAVSPPRLAPGGALRYWASRASDAEPSWLLRIDSAEIATPVRQPGPVTVAATGPRWAAVGSVDATSGAGSESAVWADGALINRYPDMTRPVFSRDGAHYAYLGDAGLGMVGLFVDGKREHLFEAPDVPFTPVRRGTTPGAGMDAQYVIRYLSDGTVLSLTTDFEGWSVYRDQRRVASYNGNEAGVSGDAFPVVEPDSPLQHLAAIVGSSLTSASDAPVVAWWARDPGPVTRWRVLRDGTSDTQTCKQPARDQPPALSADGTHIAYACYLSASAQPDQMVVVHDQHRYGPYSGVKAVAISPDGSRLAFAVRNDARSWSYVVDGKRYATRFTQVFPPRFSADGQHVAWVGQRSRPNQTPRFVLQLDGNGYASSDRYLIAPDFVAGSARLRWAVQRGRRISRVEVGG